MPEIPSRTWFDPVLGAYMHTGNDALSEAMRLEHHVALGSTPVAIDIETPGLDRAFEINCVTAAWHYGASVHTVILDPLRTPGDRLAFGAIRDCAKTLVLQNACFDIPALVHHGLMSIEDCNKVVDTLVLARMAFPDKMIKKSLESLAVRHLGWTDFSGGMLQAFHAAGHANKETGYRNMDIDSPIYRQGAMADTVATLWLEPILRRKCQDWLTDHPFEIYGATTRAEADELISVQETVHRVMLRRTARGLNVDSDYLNVYSEKVADERDRAVAELATHGVEGGMGKQAGLITEIARRGELPLDWPLTATGKLRATKADLDNLDHPIAAAQRKLADIDKVLGYLEKVSHQASVTGRCHPQVGTLGASATGRMSYSYPELQQFPEDARPILRDDGQGWTSIDWVAVEPVTMALMAGDEKFLEPFENGADLYEPIQRAAEIDRKIAKVVLLATMYGQGTAKLARTIGHTEESAAHIKRQMLAAMPACRDWMAKVQGIGDECGKIVTIGGRILPVDVGFGYKAVNFCCQGSAYDLLANTIVEMERRGIGDHVDLAMHDELVVDTEVADEVREIMETPPEFLVRWAGRKPVLRTDMEDLGHSWKKC